MRYPILILMIAFGVSLYNLSHADTCGAVPCSDITDEQSIDVIENLLKDAGTDCQSVERVKLLEKSEPGIMVIYAVKCDDGSGIQDYQIIHWPAQREINIDKFTGEWMDAMTIRY